MKVGDSWNSGALRHILAAQLENYTTPPESITLHMRLANALQLPLKRRHKTARSGMTRILSTNGKER